MTIIISHVLVTKDGVWIGNSIYYTIGDLHNLQSLHNNRLSLFPLVFTIRFLATDL
jgi:hypothetical protein